MNPTTIDIEVKLPFLKIPVQMNHQFFRKRFESGYFRIVDHPFPTNTYGQEDEQDWAQLTGRRRFFFGNPDRNLLGTLP